MYNDKHSALLVQIHNIYTYEGYTHQFDMLVASFSNDSYVNDNTIVDSIMALSQWEIMQNESMMHESSMHDGECILLSEDDIIYNDIIDDNLIEDDVPTLPYIKSASTI